MTLLYKHFIPSVLVYVYDGFFKRGLSDGISWCCTAALKTGNVHSFFLTKHGMINKKAHTLNDEGTARSGAVFMHGFFFKS